MTTSHLDPALGPGASSRGADGPIARTASSFYRATGAAALSLLDNPQLNHSPQITAVESHTQGEPTRIVVGGLPEFHESSAIAVRDVLEAHFDPIRRLLMMEPRGHRDMFGAFLFPPTRPDADLGVVYSHSGGFSNMCGHGSIGVGTFAVESGLVTGPYDSPAEIGHDDVDVRLDTPAGLVTVTVHVDAGRVTGATVANVPAFVAAPHVTLELDHPGLSQLDVTIAFGGNFFALVNADPLGIDITTRNRLAVADLGMAVLRAARAQVQVVHPLLDIAGVDLVELGSALPQARHYRNGVVFGDRQLDRSPCGTGTSAKLATFVQRGDMEIGERAVFSSITGSEFVGEAVAETRIGQYEAFVPHITGRAYTTGVSTFVLDDEDIYPQGFLL